MSIQNLGRRSFPAFSIATAQDRVIGGAYMHGRPGRGRGPPSDHLRLLLWSSVAFYCILYTIFLIVEYLRYFSGVAKLNSSGGEG